MLSIVRHHVAAQLQDLSHPLVRHPIIPITTLPCRNHIPTPAQTGEMVGEASLGNFQEIHQFGDVTLPLQQQLQDLEASWVTQASKKLCRELELLEFLPGQGIR